MTYACAELVARCFAARTSAHLAHLTTTSYAQHVALGDFYDAIASGADMAGKSPILIDLVVPSTRRFTYQVDFVLPTFR